jgi:ribonuclease HI
MNGGDLMLKTIELWTDGSYNPETGIGAYAYVVRINNTNVKRNSKAFEETKMSSERMELRGIVEGLKNLNLQNIKYVNVYCDAQYLIEDILYIKEIKNRGWKKNKSDVDTISNLDLWLELFQIIKNIKESKLKLCFHWVKGHNYNISTPNLIVDKLARKTRKKYEEKIKLENTLIIETSKESIPTTQKSFNIFKILFIFIKNICTNLFKRDIINI